ncbi:hypothetical protein ACU79H_004285 [Vibrio fluvialis]
MSSDHAESMDDFIQKDKDLRPKDFITKVENEELKERAHNRIRKNVLTVALIVLVLAMNWYVVDFISELSFMEMDFISKSYIKPEARVVSEKVILALLGGTVAQVSALLFVVVRSSFHGGDSEGNGKSSD